MAKNRENQPIPICIGCSKRAEELEEYIEEAEDNDMEVNEYVRVEEGTYNSKNGHFMCTACYIDAGMPTRPEGWVAP